MQNGTPPRRAVLITGCDSGFGLATARKLADSGDFDVYACCLTQAGVDRLARDANVSALRLDVTRVDEIAALAKRLREGDLRDKGLYCLVNNAGVFGGSDLVELCPTGEHRRIFDVNYWGPVEMSRALLPLLRVYGKGARIVNVSSVAGRCAAPAFGPYAASKHALEAFSDSLRRELRASRQGIAVCLVEPWFARTAILPDVAEMDRGAEERLRGVPDEVVRVYGGVEERKRANRAAHALLHSRVAGLMDAGVVVDRMCAAVCAERPGARCLVGFPHAHVSAALETLLPTAVADLLYSVAS